MQVRETEHEQLAEISRTRAEMRVTKQARHFVRGPIPMPWLEAAARLPGRALAVGLLIWFRAGIAPNDPVGLTPNLLGRFGIERKAGYRAIEALRSAGLIEVDRHRGRCPRVTILKAIGRS